MGYLLSYLRAYLEPKLNDYYQPKIEVSRPFSREYYVSHLISNYPVSFFHHNENNLFPHLSQIAIVQSQNYFNYYAVTMGIVCQ